MKNNEIKFIKPCRYPEEEHRKLTPEYTIGALRNGRIVQINLDNCSIQRMEQLNENSTIDDVEEVGLLPLCQILQNGMVSLSAIGINEMPDWYVENAHAAYQLFCRKFWPGHKDDKDATFREYDPNNYNRKIVFDELPNDARCTYGSAYIAILQIQNIKLNYSELTPERQFETFLYSMIGYLDIVSGFELEIAKYSFWNLTANQINQLPPKIRQRRRDIKDNFSKFKTDLNKCKHFAFDAAMDLHWLSGANLSEDFGHVLEIDGVQLKLDNWVGTNDHKLYRISKDIHSAPFSGSTMKRLAITREEYFSADPYWIHVDSISKSILQYRLDAGYSRKEDLLKRIDAAVSQICADLEKAYSLEPV